MHNNIEECMYWKIIEIKHRTTFDISIIIKDFVYYAILWLIGK